MTVPRLPLDELVPRPQWSSVDLVKIDAEGHTHEAIEGGAGLFSTGAPMVLFEILLESGALEESLAERFREWGYGIYRWVPGPGVLEPVPRDLALDTYQMNLVALKPERAAALAARGLVIGDEAIVADAPAGAWEAHASGLALSGHMAGRWRHRARWFDGSGVRGFRRALDLYAYAVRPGTHPRSCVANLHAALGLLSSTPPESDPVAVLCAVARIAAALGLRSRSTAALQVLVTLAQAGSTPFGGLPFPPPAPRFDTVAVAGPEVEWMEAAIYEAALDQAAWSAFFVGADWLPLVERQMELPYSTALVRRRLQLIRIRHGLQAGPQPDAGLLETPGATLNPGFWRGRAPPRN